MNRRRFLQTGASALACSRLPAYAAEFADQKKRVGLIGSGWYGKCDLLPPDPGRAGRGRLAVRRRQARCSPRPPSMVADAPGLEEEAAHLRRLPRDAQGEGPRHRPDRHARPLARPADDRRRRGRRRRLRAEADQRRRGRGPGDARRRAQAQARRAGRHAAPQHAAPDRGPRPHHQGRQARQDRPRRDLLLLPHARARENPPDTAPPDYLDYEMWTGPAPMRPYNSLVHPRGWRAFMEYGNGIMGDMCIHMLDMVRWMLDLGWPKRISSTGGILVRQGEQGEHHRHADRHVRLRRPARRLAASHLGRAARPEVSLGRDVLRRQGHAEGRACTSYDFIPPGGGTPIHKRRRPTSSSSIPRTRPRRTWSSTSPRRSARHMKDFLARDRLARQAGGRHRGGPHLDAPAASWPTCRMKLGRTLTWDAATGNVVGATTRRTACCAGPIARPGCIRIQRRSDGSVRARQRRIVRAPVEGARVRLSAPFSLTEAASRVILQMALNTRPQSRFVGRLHSRPCPSRTMARLFRRVRDPSPSRPRTLHRRCRIHPVVHCLRRGPFEARHVRHSHHPGSRPGPDPGCAPAAAAQSAMGRPARYVSQEKARSSRRSMPPSTRSWPAIPSISSSERQGVPVSTA